MKKLLLIVFAVLSMNAFAQAPKIKSNLKIENTSKFKNMAKRINLQKVSKANKVKAKAPVSGTTKTYYADYAEYAYQIGVLDRYHVKYDIVFGDNGEVSISNLFSRNYIGTDLYITGKYNEATNEITIDNNQYIYNDPETGYDFFVSTVNTETETGDPSTETFKLKLDPETGIISSEDPDAFLGLYVTDGSQTAIYTYACALNYYPEDMFPAATTHNYTCDDYYGETQSSTVDIVTLGDVCYVKSLMPNYPEAWLKGYINGNDIVLNSFAICEDDIAMLFGTETEYVDNATFAYNSATDSYSSESGIDLSDYFYYDGDGKYYFTEMYENMIIKGGVATGISSVENSKDAVSTEYFDLSGRRINNAAKGISIMVKKYADGTSKAVKVMK